MRNLFLGLKAIFIVLLTVACGAAAAVLFRAPVFQGGKNYELYLSPSSSSLTVLTENPALDKLFFPVRGESVRYDGNEKDALIARFHAKILFTEEAADVMNYYCSSPFLGSGVGLNGHAVNLHIAVSATQTAVGTPLIFGGF